MKMRQLVLLTLSAALLSLSAGCELLVDFDRNKIDPMVTTDACISNCEDAGPDSGSDAGSDASDDDGGSMDAGPDADVMIDSGTDSGGMIDAAMDGSDDEDSGL